MEDPFLSYIKGYSDLDSMATDVLDLNRETMFIRGALFPLYRKPVPENPDRATLENDYFYLECEDLNTYKHIGDYFLEKHFGYRDNLYGNGDTLGNFLEMIAHQLMVSGVVFHEIIWDEVEIDGKKYQLPVDFHYLRDSTMKVVVENNDITGYQQSYSLITYLLNRFKYKMRVNQVEIRKVKFSKDEVFYCKYPFAPKSPAERSVKYLKLVRKFWDFTLDQTASSAYPENHLLNIERARYKTFLQEKRKQDVARTKIRRIFNYIPEGEGLYLTSYYDIYTVIQYRKFLNKMRTYLVDEFNKQVLNIVTEKNGLPKMQIRYQGFITNADLDKAFKDYASGTLSRVDIIEKVIRVK